MPRLAWFSPVRPVKSGIAHCNHELLPALAPEHAIDVFVDGLPEQFVSPDERVSSPARMTLSRGTLANRMISSSISSATRLATTTCGRTSASRLKHAADQKTVGPVGVSIDIVDEHHSFELSLRKLATDATLRTMLGDNAQLLWGQRWRLDQMASGYRRAIEAALACAGPDPSSRAQLPPHLLVDGTEHTDQLLRETGLSEALRSRLWQGHAE